MLLALGIFIVIAPVAAAESGAEAWRGAAWISGLLATVLIFLLLWVGGSGAATPKEKD